MPAEASRPSAEASRPSARRPAASARVRGGLLALVGEAGSTRRAEAREVAAAWAVSHLLVWAAGLLGIAVLAMRPDVGPFDPAGLSHPFGSWLDTAVGPGVRWDSVWFLSVARDGYGSDIAKPAFFPLYPLLTAAVGGLTGSLVIGGLLVSWVSMAVAFLGLRRLCALELGEGAARHAVWLVAVFPAALFGSAIYAESLFLALSVWSLLSMRTGHVVHAVLLGALACATRSAGLVLLVPLFLLLVRERGWRPDRTWLWLAVVPLGLAAFSLWLELFNSSWRAPFDAQQQWLRAWTGPFVGAWDGVRAGWAGLRQVLSGQTATNYWPQAGGDVMDAARTNLTLGVFLLLAIPALVGAARRLPLAYVAYCLAALAMPLSYAVGPQPLMSLPRFEWVLFPLFMWGGWWLHRRGRAWKVAVYGASVLALCWFSAQFATWQWVA